MASHENVNDKEYPRFQIKCCVRDYSDDTVLWNHIQIYNIIEWST